MIRPLSSRVPLLHVLFQKLFVQAEYWQYFPINGVLKCYRGKRCSAKTRKLCEQRAQGVEKNLSNGKLSTLFGGQPLIRIAQTANWLPYCRYLLQKVSSIHLLSDDLDNSPEVGEIREFSIFTVAGEIGPGRSGEEVLVSATLSPANKNYVIWIIIKKT